jgi:hypothetical protein
MGTPQVNGISRLDDDGNVYLGLFLDNHAFVWDGIGPVMEVSQGGMGEPVTDTVKMTPTAFATIRLVRQQMLDAANAYLERDTP